MFETRHDELSLIELDYADHELSMLFLLPTRADGLEALEASLTQARVDELLSKAVPEESGLELPRLELRAELPLAELLQSLGVTTAFDPAAADFSGMLSDGGKDIYLSRARHQAFVQVDERGTKAAAATAIVGSRHAAATFLSVDHPFAFAIRDKLTGALLFAGRVVDPR
jgi:serpin B